VSFVQSRAQSRGAILQGRSSFAITAVPFLEVLMLFWLSRGKSERFPFRKARVSFSAGTFDGRRGGESGVHALRRDTNRIILSSCFRLQGAPSF
jgi:hypothetical protein